MGAGKVHRVNKSGQTTKNYGGGHTGKGKKGASKKRDIRSVYAAGNHSVLKKTTAFGQGERGQRVRKSNVVNPVWFGMV